MCIYLFYEIAITLFIVIPLNLYYGNFQTYSKYGIMNSCVTITLLQSLLLIAFSSHHAHVFPLEYFKANADVESVRLEKLMIITCLYMKTKGEEIVLVC